ncbi:hypothetical protein HK096_011573 [Nowakowskiella sp. JEL0078]|nr:hypothetical protein HK096_011573 [Nowakowskiella sp. JEL0078]
MATFLLRGMHLAMYTAAEEPNPDEQRKNRRNKAKDNTNRQPNRVVGGIHRVDFVSQRRRRAGKGRQRAREGCQGNAGRAFHRQAGGCKGMLGSFDQRRLAGPGRGRRHGGGLGVGWAVRQAVHMLALLKSLAKAAETQFTLACGSDWLDFMGGRKQSKNQLVSFRMEA